MIELKYLMTPIWFDKSEAFSVDDGGSGLLIFGFGNPHSLEGGKGG